MKFISFGSGSSGNCYILQQGDSTIVVDVGIGIRTFKRYCNEYGIPAGKANAILVTHDHTDHVKAVGAVSREYNIPVFTSEEVHRGMDYNRFMSKKVPPALKRILSNNSPITIGEFTITSIPVPHDSSGNNGYIIEGGGTTLCIITDAGRRTPEIEYCVENADYLVIEANYDMAMLATGPYPAYLKQRIRSGNGHLCNDETAALLAEKLTERTKHVWLCHLSEENNNPQIALRTINEQLEERLPLLHANLKIEALRRRIPSQMYELD